MRNPLARVALTLFTTVPVLLTSQALALGALAAQEPVDASTEDAPAEEVLAALQADFERRQEALIQRYQAATTDEERAALPDVNHGPWQEVLPEVTQAAATYAGTPGAVPFLLWTVSASSRMSKRPEAERAIDTLLKQHVTDERLTELAGFLPRYRNAFGVKETLRRARRLQAGSKHIHVQAAAMLAATRIEGLKGDALEQALEQIAGFAPKSASGIRAAGQLYELRHLQIGMTVPEILGQTIDGEAFRLSDYRGKVCVLEFWSIHCGPCVAKVPKTIERLKRNKDAPFAHIGIHTARPSGDAVRDFAKEHGVTWPVVLDRASATESMGPIGSQWQISGWPTVYVIDHKGVIRSTWTSEAKLKEMLPALLRAAEDQ